MVRPQVLGMGDDVARLLQRADIHRLRTLLSAEEPFVCRMADLQVRASVARLAQRGRFGLFELVDTRTDANDDALPIPRIGTALPVPAPRPPSVPAAPRGQPASAPLREPLAATPAADPLQAIDQDAQAATLIAAASRGLAFCEECAKRAAARAAAAFPA